MRAPSAEQLFWHYTDDEPTSIQLQLADDELGPYLFFRRSKTAIQARLAQLFPHENVPHTFLHGSPHIDNYAKTSESYGIIDFDRAYIGPYIWDIVCCLLAINLRNPDRRNRPLSKNVLKTFQAFYSHHFQHPDLSFQPYVPLENITPKKWETDKELYLSGHHKWAKKLHSAAVPLNDPIAHAVLADYKTHLPHPSSFKNLHLTQLARTTGSFGRKRYLYLLENSTQKSDPVILDIKETRNYLHLDWPHNQWYHSPCVHQGERMIQAAMLYAPDSVQLESYATVNGIQYWGRQVPILNRKPAKLFNKADQVAFAESAASQLGRGHRLGLDGCSPDILFAHFEKNWDTLVTITEKIQSELLTVWKDCIPQGR